MNFNIKELENKLCSLLCAEIKLHTKNADLIAIETPFSFPDGDPYQIYLKEMPGGIMRLTDMGHTLMHLSYDNDIETFREGTRSKLLEQIKSDTSLEEDNGEFYVDTNINNIGADIFKISHALIKINDLTFLNRFRVESTFYEDLRHDIIDIIGEDNLHEDYIYTSMNNAEDYPIDFMIKGKQDPLFLFGVPNKDKARLTTIILERLLRSNANFDSLIIFAEQESIPKRDLARLSNVGGEMIASLDAKDDLKRKIMRRAEYN